jgi:hypothetical protein
MNRGVFGAFATILAQAKTERSARAKQSHGEAGNIRRDSGVQGPFDDLFDDLPTSGRMRSIRRDLLDRPIATVMDSEQASRHYLAFMRGDIDEATLNTRLTGCILQEGMSKEEIEAAFPPAPAIPGQSDLAFNRTALIATILWQEWQRVGKRRPQGNIRHFWYTHLMFTLTRVLGDSKIDSILNCYNHVLKSLVKQEGFQYADLNLVSIKSDLCEAIFADSPYPNILMACEKESYHTYLKRLAHVFHVTFLSLGGQGSYQVYEDLVFQFMEHGIDLDQEFRLLTVTDFDPHGYKIEATAKEHLERAGIRRVTIERVYLGAEHITQGIKDRFAVPYEVQKKKASATKGACSLYNWFGAITGGIYQRDDAWVQFPRNGDGTYHVPQLTTGDEGYKLYRVELDNFREDVLIELLIDALERLIDGAEYYYTAAKRLWRQTIRRGAVDAATTLIHRAVREKLRPFERSLSELRDRLEARWAALTAEEDTLIAHVKEDRDFHIESLQEQIDGLQARIDALREQREDLERQQASLRETADDVVDFLHAVQRTVAPEIPAAQQLLDPIDDRLTAYGDEQEATQADTVAAQFDRERVPIREVIDCSPHAGTVFQRARAGAETFTAELTYTEQRRVTSAAEDDLETQQETMRVEVPDLPLETVDAIGARIRRAEVLLAQAERNGEIPEEWRALLRLLAGHYLNDHSGWNPWEDWDEGGWR